ncbi:MAG TPA: hypothetical protein DCY88_02980 [Cyanobacteria bacterium UBA11372]|nr:hypothetical protein [Cyanobacteria bacterium UBA11372]
MELIFATDNSKQFSTTLTPGQCMGMSCDWAKVSLTLKDVYFDALTPGKWDLGQTAYEMGTSRTDRKIIEAFLMRITNGGGNGIRHNVGTALDVVNNLVALPQGIYVWGLEGHGGGHALGYERTATTYDLFDPNFGLLRTDNLLDFRQTLTDSINDYYSDLLQNQDIYQVALP